MDEAPALGDHQLVPSAPKSKLKVLLIDDSAGFRNIARELLRHRGHSVAAEADCVAGAWKALERCDPDAVLLDVNLPDGNGFDLAEELMGAHPGLAVVLVSATNHLPQGGDACAYQFVPKSRLASVDFESLRPGGQTP